LAVNLSSLTGHRYLWAAPLASWPIFPLFLLGAVFGKLMDDTRSVTAIADYMTNSLGKNRAMLAVVLAGTIVTYGGG
jgi:di/tricarboxylate transporter